MKTGNGIEKFYENINSTNLPDQIQNKFKIWKERNSRFLKQKESAISLKHRYISLHFLRVQRSNS